MVLWYVEYWRSMICLNNAKVFYLFLDQVSANEGRHYVSEVSLIG